MTQYSCPNCMARSRFNIIEQVATPVRMDLQTGEKLVLEHLDPFHLPYQGPEIRVQCATCGLVEDELRFIKMAQNSSLR